MTPSARLAAAAAILDGLDLARAVEPQLKAWSRANRYAGSKDRRAIADRVYTVLRRRRSAAARGGGENGRALVLGSLAVEDDLDVDAIAALCTGGYGLDPLAEAERTVLANPLPPATEAAALDWPDWLWPHAVDAFGAKVAAELAALRCRAPLDLRVNTLKTTREAARAALAAEGMPAEPLAICDTALRLPPGTPVMQGQAARLGWVEPQDAASQRVAALLDAMPGERVLDLCAGAGGKTLALAASMQDRGVIVAHDADPRRMTELPARAARAGATIITMCDDIDGTFDAVLIDAPCSGSGSWRRDPAGKWRLSPQGLDTLVKTQRDILENAAPTVTPGGRLVYATCSVLHRENRAQTHWFLDAFPVFDLDQDIVFSPFSTNTDGFYAALLRRRKD